MSAKDCKVKLCNCFGFVKDSRIGDLFTNQIAGLTSSYLETDILDSVTTEQETRLFDLLTKAETYASESNVLKLEKCLKKLGSLALEIADG